jgi:predicted O-methyltransferase YrrM
MKKYLLPRIWHLLKTGKFREEISAHYKHKKKKEEAVKILPEISLEELTGNIQPLLLEMEARDGNVTPDELKALASLSARFKPQNIFEIGTFDGRTSLNLIANAAPDAKLFTLDLPKTAITETALRIKTGDRKFIDKPQSGSRFLNTPYAAHIQQIYADSAVFDYTPYHNTMDMIFVDGAHSYEYVINDTEKVLPLLKNGKGIILWHDYGWYEVILALNEYYKQDPRFKKLVNIKGSTIACLILE